MFCFLSRSYLVPFPSRLPIDVGLSVRIGLSVRQSVRISRIVGLSVRIFRIGQTNKRPVLLCELPRTVVLLLYALLQSLASGATSVCAVAVSSPLGYCCMLCYSLRRLVLLLCAPLQFPVPPGYCLMLCCSLWRLVLLLCWSLQSPGFSLWA